MSKKLKCRDGIMMWPIVFGGVVNEIVYSFYVAKIFKFVSLPHFCILIGIPYKAFSLKFSHLWAQQFTFQLNSPPQKFNCLIFQLSKANETWLAVSCHCPHALSAPALNFHYWLISSHDPLTHVIVIFSYCIKTLWMSLMNISVVEGHGVLLTWTVVQIEPNLSDN